MELKRKPVRAVRGDAFSFNRTTMELKLHLLHHHDCLLLSFNRTTMELKLPCKFGIERGISPFNRTTMELKR